MLNESQFNILVDSYLEMIANEIELKDEDMLIDVDLTPDMLTLELDSGQQYVISKNNAAKQLWLSSPISGGLHYNYNEISNLWELIKDGSRFDELLTKELYHYTSTIFDFIGK